LPQLFNMKKIAYLLLLACLVTFQSCFEIIEQVFLKNDGSGNFQLTINLSKSKTKINSIMKMKTVNGHPVPSEEQVRQKIKTIENTVSKTDGISNVKTTIDFDNYIATISCDFSKVSQLNAAVKNINDKENGKTKSVENIYEYNASTATFSRLNKFSLKKDYNKMSNADKEVFTTANYTAIYKFESSVTTASNRAAKISPSKKAIMLKQNALDVITNNKSIENKINLTK
jgi:hypothetical protein